MYVMTLLKIELLINWWVSAVLEHFSLQVHLSARLSASCFIAVFLSMLDFQPYPDSPNDNAAGKRKAVDGGEVNKKKPKSPLPPLPASSTFPSSPVSRSGQPRGDQTCL